MRPAVGDFASVRRVHRPRRHRVVRRRVHVVPPADVGAGEARIDLPGDLPEFGPLDQMVGLPPELDLALVAKVPAVADDAVLAGPGAGEISGLHRRCHSGQHVTDVHEFAAIGQFTQPGSKLSQQVRRQPDRVNDEGFVHERMTVDAGIAPTGVNVTRVFNPC